MKKYHKFIQIFVCLRIVHLFGIELINQNGNNESQLKDAVTSFVIY